MIAGLPPGEVIPGTRYRVLEKMAEGAMGAVYAAEHVDLEKRVALKALLAEIASSPQAIERLRAEARAASKIGSPFICDVTDFGSLPGGEVFFVMEYLPGRSLAQVLDDPAETMDPARAIGILRQVCKALGAAHEQGIVHLDIKPDNVMLVDSARRRDAVKVVDFGVAGLIDQAGDEERIAGTSEYIAPERAMGRGYDHRTDIYALGIMAYEMVTGQVPFAGDDLLTVLKRHVQEAPVPPSRAAPDRNIPKDLESVILQMIAKDPGQRPQRIEVVEAMLCEAQIAADLRTEWDHLDLPAVDDAWQKKLAARMPSRGGHRRGLVLGALGLATVAAGLAIFLAMRQPREIIKVVRVGVTDTEEAEPVARLLENADEAARKQRYVRPSDSSALHFIELAEDKAASIKRKSVGAQTLRRGYASALAVTGNELLKAGLRDLAIVKLKEALQFLPDDPELTKLADLSASERSALRSGGRGKVTAKDKPPSPEEQAKDFATDLFLAARKQHFSEARVAAQKLTGVDREGLVRARMADALRGLAAQAWDRGDRRVGRSYYQLVLDLDPADLEAQARVRLEIDRPPEPAEPPPEPVAVETKGKDAGRGKGKTRASAKGDEQGDETAIADSEAPRDVEAAKRAIADGQSALRAGRLGPAEEAFNRGVRADPLNPAAVGGLAEVEFERARYTTALDYARRAARLAPRSPQYQIVLGDAYFKLLRYEEARAAYARARELSGGKANPEIAARLDRVNAKLGK